MAKLDEPIQVQSDAIAKGVSLNSKWTPTQSRESAYNQIFFTIDAEVVLPKHVSSVESGQALHPIGDAPTQISGLNSAQYRSTDEVDTRAAPRGDWRILRQHLPKGLLTLQLDIWISSEGRIDWFDVVSPTPTTQDLAKALSEFRFTTMEPATLNDVPVASKMSIELELE